MPHDPIDIPDWAGWAEDTPRSLSAIRFSERLDDIDRAYRHSHAKAQLMYCARGALTCEVDRAILIVPPETAVWIPAGLPHKAFGTGSVECCSLLIAADAHPDLPTQCGTIGVSPLLRELIVAAVAMPDLYDNDSRDGRVAQLLIDELARAIPENLTLPMPSDPRLSRLVASLLDNPGDDTAQTEWATRLGLSERSFRRLFAEQLGVNFGRWRHQLHVILAIRRMTAGESVQTISIDLGYESASSFITMFKKVMGKPPARFLADHRSATTIRDAAS